MWLNKEGGAIKRSRSGHSFCFAWLFQSVILPSIPQTTLPPKKEQLRKRAVLFLVSAFQVFTHSFPALVGATKSKIQLHFVTLRSTAFQQYYCLSPHVNLVVALSTSHGVCSTTFCICLRNASLTFIFSPRFTLLSLHSTSLSLRFILGLVWLIDATTPTSAPRSQKKLFYMLTA